MSVMTSYRNLLYLDPEVFLLVYFPPYVHTVYTGLKCFPQRIIQGLCNGRRRNLYHDFWIAVDFLFSNVLFFAAEVHCNGVMADICCRHLQPSPNQTETIWMGR